MPRVRNGLPGIYNASAFTLSDGDGSALSTDANGNIIISSNSVVSFYTSTDKIYNATTALTPKFAFANVSASQTDSAVVAAVTSKKIRVLALYALPGSTATDLTFNSKPAGSGTAISAKFANGANGGEVLPFSQVGWFETASGEGLSVTTGAGATTGIGVVYVEV